MHKFKDKTGREWSLPELTLNEVISLRTDGIEVHDLLESGYLWEDLSGDAWVMIGALCWNLCQGQHGIDEETFYKSWNGDVFTAAQEASREAILNFIPTARRTVLIERMRIVQETAKLLPMLNESMVTRINSILSESATDGLAKLALPTLVDTLSEKSPGLPPDDGSSTAESLPKSSTSNEPSLTSEVTQPSS